MRKNDFFNELYSLKKKRQEIDNKIKDLKRSYLLTNVSFAERTRMWSPYDGIIEITRIDCDDAGNISYYYRKVLTKGNLSSREKKADNIFIFKKL